LRSSAFRKGKKRREGGKKKKREKGERRIRILKQAACFVRLVLSWLPLALREKEKKREGGEERGKGERIEMRR